MASSEFSRVWATATEISLEKDVAYTEEAAVTIFGIAEEDGAEEDEVFEGQKTREVKNRPTDKLLKVESGWEKK